MSKVAGGGRSLRVGVLQESKITCDICGTVTYPASVFSGKPYECPACNSDGTVEGVSEITVNDDVWASKVAGGGRSLRQGWSFLAEPIESLMFVD